MNYLGWLCDWYAKQCDGEWEHASGILIDTLDNPGWRVEIGLAGTALEEVRFSRVEVERNDGDWFHCWRGEGKFEAACGRKNLTEVIETFRLWAEDAELEASAPDE